MICCLKRDETGLCAALLLRSRFAQISGPLRLLVSIVVCNFNSVTFHISKHVSKHVIIAKTDERFALRSHEALCLGGPTDGRNNRRVVLALNLWSTSLCSDVNWTGYGIETNTQCRQPCQCSEYDICWISGVNRGSIPCREEIYLFL